VGGVKWQQLHAEHRSFLVSSGKFLYFSKHSYAIARNGFPRIAGRDNLTLLIHFIAFSWNRRPERPILLKLNILLKNRPMKRLRSILPIFLAAFAILLVSCGGNVAKAPPVYTPEKIAEIQRYMTPVYTARERMPELAEYIEEEDWGNVDSFIHGPLGGLSSPMGYINRSVVLAKDRPALEELYESFYDDIERLDAAAQTQVYSFAIAEYKTTLKDFDAYIDLIPTESDIAS
jgi:photosystem II protein PsbQ